MGKLSVSKLIVNPDCGRLLIAAKARDVNLREVLSFELSPALAYPDSTLKQGTKSVLGILEKLVESPSQLSVPEGDASTAHIFD